MPLTRLALLFVFLLASLSAQVGGRLSGNVQDSSGAPIPNAAVSLTLAGGQAAVLATTTTQDGIFTLVGIRPDFYDVRIEAQGFRKETTRKVKIDPGVETTMGAIKLEVGSVTEVVEVLADAQTVQTSNSEITTTVTNDQIRLLPSINRSPLAVMATQPGVSLGRGVTVINGQRTSFSNVTMDGINIQDNLIRGNGLDFLPNLLLIDQIAEATLLTSNASAVHGGGSSQILFVSKSGTNDVHGSVYWYNRNNALSANTWFNNRDKIGRPFLNQNQAGYTFGGPIIKDKLLFYTNYELFRLRQQSTQDRTILTDDARKGIFTYLAGGETRKVNVLQARGIQADPTVAAILQQVPGADKINNTNFGDGRNYSGYSFLGRNNRTRDNLTAKVDYIFSTKNVFTGTYAWNRDIVDRQDVANNYEVVPNVTNSDGKNLVSGAWRWNPTPSLTNELRAGFNLAPASFPTTQEFPKAILAIPTAPSTPTSVAAQSTLFANPVNVFRAQGRDTNTYTLNDNASKLWGRHNFQFGFQSQRIRSAPYNDAGITPTYTLGTGTGNQGLVPADLPGSSSADQAIANSLLAALGGYITSYTQTFNVTSRSSGFVDGATNLRNFSFDNYAGYFQDSWKIRRRLTLNLGVRYEYFTRVDERDSLVLMPVLQNNNPVTTLLSNSTLDFAGGSAGRPWYGADRNNFAPNLSLAWDVRGDGRTAVRAGYSVHFVNDETVIALRAMVLNNTGLGQTRSASGVTARISTTGIPAIATPVYKVPRTFQDNYALSATSAFGLPDPNLRTPYVQEWTLAVQQQIKSSVLEVRYVGNHGTKLFRAFDYNQVIIRENGFLADFNRALNNGNLSRAAGLGFIPTYNPNVAGSQPLPFFGQLPNGGNLTNATNVGFLQQGQVGEMANSYMTSGTNGPAVSFVPNRFAQQAQVLTNYSNSSYNALQIDLRRRLQAGVQIQGNYTFSKVLSDQSGDAQTRFEGFLDNANPKLERSRAPFDLNHQIKANGIWDLPFGKGHRLNGGPLQRLVGGWALSGIMVWQSGTPFSILSGRGTLNRSGLSGDNGADTTLNKSQLNELMQLRFAGNGPYFMNTSAIGADGRGVAADGSAPFSGQAFSQPVAGNLGGLQPRMFSGPWAFNLDFGIVKNTAITERQSIELRMESQNILNHPTWRVDDQTITATTFGRITNSPVAFGRRLIQFGLYYKF